MSLILNRPLTLFRPELKLAPGHPNGGRILVAPLPIAGQSEAGIITPDVAKTRPMAGYIVTVGDDAADKMYVRGHEKGDEVWYAKYAGVVEDWQHLIRAGEGKCGHEGAWDRVPKDDGRWLGSKRRPDEDTSMHACRSCGALKLQERVVIMDVEDILLNVDLQVRLEAGTFQRVRGVNRETGAVQYGIVRPSDWPDSFEIKGAA